MNIMIFTGRGKPRQVNLASPLMLSLAFASLVMVLGLFFAGGFAVAQHFISSQPGRDLAAWQQRLEAEQKEIEKARQDAQDNVNALALRLGELNAHIIRLDALGQRLTKMAGLDEGEFNFDEAPAQGGPETPDTEETMPVPDFVKSLDQLAAQIEDRQKQLTVLENLLMNRNLQKQVMPAGRPIKHGWLSSYFGMRTDPFTGRMAMHEGMDFAGKRGSDVMAVAAGVVTWAGPRYGYGNLVEINHGNGYATRYGHNEEVLVKVGDTVKKGQVIAHMGSTGRSTGPHVHFEVLHNGRPVNPARYIQAAR
ncbi:MAG: peptidoglycan DD-metalloendopeptidase family protein [Gammaproteobacteria bacterium]